MFSSLCMGPLLDNAAHGFQILRHPEELKRFPRETKPPDPQGMVGGGMVGTFSAVEYSIENRYCIFTLSTDNTAYKRTGSYRFISSSDYCRRTETRITKSQTGHNFNPNCSFRNIFVCRQRRWQKSLSIMAVTIEVAAVLDKAPPKVLTWRVSIPARKYCGPAWSGPVLPGLRRHRKRVFGTDPPCSGKYGGGPKGYQQVKRLETHETKVTWWAQKLEHEVGRITKASQRRKRRGGATRDKL